MIKMDFERKAYKPKWRYDVLQPLRVVVVVAVIAVIARTVIEPITDAHIVCSEFMTIAP